MKKRKKKLTTQNVSVTLHMKYEGADRAEFQKDAKPHKAQLINGPAQLDEPLLGSGV